MRKDLGKQPAVFPMPVLMVTAYDENGTVQVMNAAWGMICGMDKIALFIDEDHATTKSIRKTRAFTVSLADRDHMDAADYYGIATGNKMPDKFARSGYHAEKSTHVNAPIKRLRGAVIKRERLFVAAFERDGLRLTVQQIPVRSPDFLCCDVRTRLQIAQNNLTVFVRDVLSVRRADRRAATVGDKETDAFDRRGGALDELLNDKDAKRLVIEGHGIAGCRRAAGGGESRRYGLARRAAADHDGLRRTVERVALGGLDFAGDQRHSRREAG